MTDYKMGYNKGRYALPALVSFVAPLQGFTNFLVYIRPRISGSWQLYIKWFSSVFFRLVRATKQSTPVASVTVDDTTSADQVPVDPSVAIAAPNHLTAQSRSVPLFRNIVAVEAPGGQSVTLS